MRLLNLRTTCFRVGTLPSVSGMVPAMELAVMSRSVRYSRLPMLGGRAPVSWLEATFRTSRGLAAVKTSGISPVKLLLPAQTNEAPGDTHVPAMCARD